MKRIIDATLKMKTKVVLAAMVVALLLQNVAAEEVPEVKDTGGQCCLNPPTLNPTGGSGKVEKFAGLNTYFSGPPDAKTAVVLLSDVFGYEAPQFREVVDKVGAAGYYALAPDLHHGQPYIPKTPFTPWIKEHSPDKGYEDAKPIFEALKGKGITKVGAAGFCWGGKVVVRMASEPCIQVGVLLHPSHTTVEEIKQIKVPLSVLAAENDDITPVQLIRDYETAFKAMPQVETNVKIFPGATHGWAVRFDKNDPAAVKAADEVQKDMMDWLVNHLK